MGIIKRKYAPSSSSSEDYDADSGVSTIEFYMTSKDPYRVAPGNQLAIPWPYRMSRVSQATRDIVGNIRTEYETILSDHNITLLAETMRHLSPKHTSDTSRDTLILISRDEDPRPWKNAATAIQTIINQQLSLGNTDLKIQVELRNDLKMYKDRSFIVRQNTAEHSLLEKAQLCVLEEIRKLNASQWTSVSCAMRGVEDEESSRKATVVVCFTPGTKSLWAYINDRLEDALAPIIATNPDINLYVELVPGLLSPSVISDMEMSTPIYYDHLPVNPNSGSSIGPRGTQDAGTLGAWVYYTAAGHTVRKLAFLTCHHVVAPGDWANRAANDVQGIGLQGRSILQPILIDYPAPFDAAQTKIQLLEDLRGDPPNAADLRQRVDDMQKLIDAGGFGTVVHSSGYVRRNQKGHRMDWAIITVNDDSFRGQNVPVPRSQLARPQLWGNRLEYDAKLGDVISSIDPVVAQDWAAKTGRTTQVTVGDITSIAAATHWKDGTMTREHQITTADGTPFVRGGDSGSMIYNRKKEWIGMAIAGNIFEDACYFTSAAEIVEDIKEQTGGSIELV
ncbi:hypothetical protein IFR05_012278 [Cadophora sp. M221]|nr:hypothetical protein IFR05_012278 [Cadophora sp. M221]